MPQITQAIYFQMRLLHVQVLRLLAHKSKGFCYHLPTNYSLGILSSLHISLCAVEPNANNLSEEIYLAAFLASSVFLWLKF